MQFPVMKFLAQIAFLGITLATAISGAVLTQNVAQEAQSAAIEGAAGNLLICRNVDFNNCALYTVAPNTCCKSVFSDIERLKRENSLMYLN